MTGEARFVGRKKQGTVGVGVPSIDLDGQEILYHNDEDEDSREEVYDWWDKGQGNLAQRGE